MSHPGSKWASFGAVADTDYYPTDGNGGAGTGSLSTASELKNCTRCIIDAIVVTLSAAGTPTTWTIKDANGTTVQTLTIPEYPLTVNPKEIPLGIQLSVTGGFTIRSSDTNCIGIVLYRHIFDRV